MTDGTMRLHWSPRSPFVRKIMIAAHEAGLADRLELVRTVVGSTAPNRELMAENPLSKLPTLSLPDGTALFDSTVIAEYFALLAPGAGLLPQGDRLPTLRDQALGDGLLDFLLLWVDERRRAEPLRSVPLMAAYAVKFDAVVDHLEAQVPQLQARRFDIGHISIGCGLSYAGFRLPELEWRGAHPALAAWLDAFHARPAVRAAPAVDDLDAPMQPSAVLG